MIICLGVPEENKRELPLVLNESQQYIHYQKGSVVFYAIKDYIGEANLNKALSEFIYTYKDKTAPYPNAYQFTQFIRNHTPDSLQYVITDMIEKIVLYSNKTNTATAKKVDNGYEIKINIDAQKFEADEKGNETKLAFNDWIDVGAITKSATGKDSICKKSKN